VKNENVGSVIFYKKYHNQNNGISSRVSPKMTNLVSLQRDDASGVSRREST
jgi:hypothetical protein